MIRFTRQCEYAIRILLALAKQPPGTRLSTSHVYERMLIPAALAQRIVAELARGHFVNTYPGRSGGIQLARPASAINLRQVVEHVEGTICLSDCMGEKLTCPFDDRCPVRARWHRLQSLIYDELESQTFDQLAKEAIEFDRAAKGSPTTSSRPREQAIEAFDALNPALSLLHQEEGA